MKKQSIILAMIIVAIFAGCKNDVDDQLNGTWRLNNGYYEYIFHNGDFNIKNNDIDNGRGKYTTNGDKLTLTPTHIYIDEIDAELYNTTVGWKTRSQLFTIFRGDKFLAGYTDEELNAMIDESLAPITFTYTLNDNTLILTYEDGFVDTLTRQ